MSLFSSVFLYLVRYCVRVFAMYVFRCFVRSLFLSFSRYVFLLFLLYVVRSCFRYSLFSYVSLY